MQNFAVNGLMFDRGPEVSSCEVLRLDKVAAVAEGDYKQALVEGGDKKLGLSLRPRESLDRLHDRIMGFDRRGLPNYFRAVGDPVFLANCVVRETLFVHPVKEARRGVADRFAKEESQVDEPIETFVDEADAERPNRHAAAGSRHWRGAPTCCQYGGLIAGHHGGLGRDVDVLTLAGSRALFEGDQDCASGFGARMKERLRHAAGEGRAIGIPC